MSRGRGGHKWTRQTDLDSRPAGATSVVGRHNQVKRSFTWKAPAVVAQLKPLASQQPLDQPSGTSTSVAPNSSAPHAEAETARAAQELEARLTGDAQQSSSQVRPGSEATSGPRSFKESSAVPAQSTAAPGHSLAYAGVRRADTLGSEAVNLPKYTRMRTHQLVRLSSSNANAERASSSQVLVAKSTSQPLQPGWKQHQSASAVQPGPPAGTRPFLQKPRVSVSGLSGVAQANIFQSKVAIPSQANRPSASRNLSGSKPLADFRRKGKHSLVRRLSIVSAVAKTVAAVKTTKGPTVRTSLQWKRASHPQASSSTQSGPAAFKWSREGARPAAIKASALTKETRKSASVRRNVPLIRKPSRLGVKNKPVKPKQTSKLVRVGGTLYKVGGAGSGRTLKRQSLSRSATAVPAVVPKQKVSYQRKGNVLKRLLSGTPVSSASPRPRVLSNLFSMPRPRGLTSRGNLPGSSKTVQLPGARPTGLLAQIRKRAKFVNQVCTEYCRAGRCAAKEKGQCQKIHDPAKVAVCPHWLANQCCNPNCKLQHVQREDLMPTCIHFLRGACSSQDCPYLHVNLDKNALVCPDFLEGYCTRGKSCPNKHLTRRMLQDLQASKRKHKNASKPMPRKRVFDAGGGQSQHTIGAKSKLPVPISTNVDKQVQGLASHSVLPAFLKALDR